MSHSGRGGHRRGGHRRHFGGGGRTNYYYRYSPYDYMWPPVTYVAPAAVPNDDDSDDQSEKTDAIIHSLRKAHEDRQRQSQYLMYLVGVLVLVLVLYLFLKK